MGLRTQVEFAVAIGFANALNDTAFEREVTELLDTMERVSSGQTRLAESAALIALPMGGVTTGRLLYLEASAECLVRLNGSGNDPISLKRMVDPASTQASRLVAYLLLTAEFTSVHLSNESTTAVVDVRYCIVGDLTTD